MNSMIPRPEMIRNTGSTARDFCMLERNLLSHIKLALLLSLLSSSVLLRARLVPSDNPSELSGTIGYVVASLQFAAALAAIFAGAWEYYYGYWDLRNMHAFLVATKPHLGIMGVVSSVVLLTCIIVLTQS
ncbi:hypothetical protein R3P38DRAFT_3020000 [Favolaschia claudopus]|uniref:DUF202 domain-containing protein n=1 Tax=Favolaschia claudopus TaxID=2862362 RepID=A0AAW0AHH9_9AGAR